MIFPSKLHEYGASVHSLLEFSLSLKRQSAWISLFLVQYFDEENEITKQDSTWYHSMPTRADQLYQTCSFGISTISGVPYTLAKLATCQSLDKIKGSHFLPLFPKQLAFEVSTGLNTRICKITLSAFSLQLGPFSIYSTTPQHLQYAYFFDIVTKMIDVVTNSAQSTPI